MSSEKVSLDAGKTLGMLIQAELIRLPSTTFTPSAFTTADRVQSAAKLDALYLQTLVDELKKLSQAEKKE